MRTTFFGLSEGGASSLFGASGSMGGGSIFAEYASIRNGSYRKLITSYYNLDNKNNSKSKADSSQWNKLFNNDKVFSKDSGKVLAGIKSSSDKLKTAADALFTSGKKSVFNKVSVKGNDGSVSEGYDIEAIYGKVKDFVDSYNRMLEDVGQSSTDSITSKASSMVRTTAVNSKLLSNIGITVGTDNKLSLDESKFRGSSMASVKSMFNGAGSYAYSVSSSASYINYMADREASKSATYNSYGKYNYNFNTGRIYDGIF